MNPRSTERTIHQDPDNIGYWIENNVSQTNAQPRTIHQDPDQPGYWFDND